MAYLAWRFGRVNMATEEELVKVLEVTPAQKSYLADEIFKAVF